MEPDSQSEKVFRDRLSDVSASDLVRSWKAGDERAAMVLVDRYCIRLVAFIASRMGQRWRHKIDPQDIVQSAMGGFFHAAAESRIHVSQSVSAWHLLATIAKRKLLRSIDRQSAIKRGGDAACVPLDAVVKQWSQEPSQQDAEELVQALHAMTGDLEPDLRDLLRALLRGETQREIAEAQQIAERTVRRRMERLRARLASEADKPNQAETGKPDQDFCMDTLPQWHYRDFVLGKMVGHGGFGKVYRAVTQGSTPQLVAVKFLRKRLWANPDAKRQFLREIDHASRINHPSIVRYLGWGSSPHGGPYVVQQWISGTPLANHGDVSVKQFTIWMLEICNALQAVHRFGVVHGDLTPTNVLVQESGQIMITDFGFSRRSEADPQESKPGQPETEAPIGGTLGFAAPEQIHDAFGEICPRTDIYALGGLAFWYLTKRAPHDWGSVAASLSSTLSSQDVELAGIEPDRATGPLVALAAVCLRKAISQRPSEIGPLQALLLESRQERHLAGTGGGWPDEIP